jgi:hypothetical protein
LAVIFKNEAPTVIAPVIASPLEPIKGPQKLVLSALPALKQAMPEKKYKSLRKEVKTLLEDTYTYIYTDRHKYNIPFFQFRGPTIGEYFYKMLHIISSSHIHFNFFLLSFLLSVKDGLHTRRCVGQSNF